MGSSAELFQSTSNNVVATALSTQVVADPTEETIGSILESVTTLTSQQGDISSAFSSSSSQITPETSQEYWTMYLDARTNFVSNATQLGTQGNERDTHWGTGWVQ